MERGDDHWRRDGELERAKHEWRLDALDDWRATVDVWRGAVDSQLRKIVTAREIAEEVSKRMERERTLHLTVVQKGFAIVVGAVSLAAAIHGLVG